MSAVLKQHSIALLHETDTLLHQAAFYGNFEQLYDLLNDEKQKKLLNKKNRLGCTPLRLAATGGNEDCAKYLMDHGAIVDATDLKAQTPLYVAVKNKHLSVIKQLLAAGANPDGDFQCLSSPVYTASFEGFLPGLQALIDYGADLNSPQMTLGSIGSTPLHISLSYHHLDCFRCLIISGADPDIVFKHKPNDTPNRLLPSLYHSAIKHNVEVEYAELLYMAGASLYYRDLSGKLSIDTDTVNECSEYIKKLYYAPRMLTQLCRISIRNHMNAMHRLVKLNVLPLPFSLLNYLMFNDIT